MCWRDLLSRFPARPGLMALAIRFDQLIRDGVVADQAELARLGRVSRARLTQIMNLLSLAAAIQESLLFLPLIVRGDSQIHERELRPVAAQPNWRSQCQMWSELNHSTSILRSMKQTRETLKHSRPAS
jgi:hypothetical protein